MAFSLTQPLNATAGSYTAQQDRLHTLAHSGTEGVRYAPTATTGDLAVTSTGAANASVSVAAGHILIAGAGGQGSFYAYNDAATTVGPLAANASGNPRIDLIVVRVTEATPVVAFAVVQGTPAASPVAPAVTKTAGTTSEVALAQVLVPNGFTTSTQIGTGGSTITDVRPRAWVPNAAVPATTAAGFTTYIPTPQTGQVLVDGQNVMRAYTGSNWYPAPASVICTSTTKPTTVPVGQVIYESDTLAERMWNGSAWVAHGVTICTSTTRPGSPTAGQAIYETDTKRSLQHDGTGWVIMGEPVQTYTPTFTNFSSTSPTVDFRYHRSDGWVDITGTYTFGTSVSVTGLFTITVPSGCDASSATHNVSFSGLCQGTGNFPAWIGLASATTFNVYTFNAAAAASANLASTSSTSPQTWATGHSFRLGIRYQMANRYS